MSKKIIRILILSILIVCMMASNVLAVTSGGGTVTASALNMRSDASTSSAVKALIYNGSNVIVTDSVGDWYKVVYKGSEGYVHSDYVSFAATMDASFGTKGTVSGMSVRMRDAASLSSNTLGYYNTGAEFNVIGVSGVWVKVSNGAGIEGYIHSDYIRFSAGSAAAQTPAVGNGTGEQMVATAKQYLGCPYVWAGNGPYSFDCSGYVNYIYKQYGYSLHRVAQDIYSYDGVSVDKANLQPGDIICFGYGPWSITHVGMYIGNGQFIHASSGSGCVVITDLSSGYYTRMYVGAKRVIG